MALDENITPTDEQNNAINAIVAWYKDPYGKQEFYLAGYAGTGKSVTVSFVINELKRKCRVKNVYTATYTGKAASVLRNKGVDAQTIHGLIYVPVIDEKTKELIGFVKSGDSPAYQADLIILDECSMVDDKIADDLRSFRKKILVIGDPGQLPPIGGQGAFTRNTPDIFLSQIHRQSENSPILMLATRARLGQAMPKFFDEDGVMVMPLSPDSLELIHVRESQVICGTNKNRFNYTQQIRKRLGYYGDIPIAGERIICCRNNKPKALYNGLLGTLNSITVKPETYILDVHLDDYEHPTKAIEIDPVQFKNHFKDGKAVKLDYKKGIMNEFDWGYVITCHKAQGSSWENVTIIDDSSFMYDNKNAWLYTSLTRAEKGLTLLVR